MSEPGRSLTQSFAELHAGPNRSRIANARPLFALILATDDQALLEAVLPMCSRLAHDCRWLVCSDLPALRAHGARPLNEHKDSELALVAGDAALAWQLAEHRPARLFAADPLPLATGHPRFGFYDARRWYFGFEPASPKPSPEPALLLLDGFATPSADTLRALQASFAKLTVLPTAEAGEAYARATTVIATNPVAAMPPPDDKRPRYLLDWHGELYQAKESLRVSPAHHLLYAGEDWDELGLLERFLSSHMLPALDRALVVQPLISIVVAVRETTPEVVRLAGSIAEQSYSNLEVVFVAPDLTSPIAVARALLMRKKLAARFVSADASQARDIGAYAARGELLCFVSSSEALAPDFFAFASGELRHDTIYRPRSGTSGSVMSRARYVSGRRDLHIVEHDGEVLA